MNGLKKLLERLENRDMSFFGALGSVFVILFLRNFIEIFADADNLWTPISTSGFFIHYPLFHLCFFVAITIVLSIMTRGKILDVTRLSICFLPVVLLAPVLDLVLSAGSGYNMAYMFDDLPILIQRYLTFTGGSHRGGATPGIRLELLVIFLFIGIYIYLKTRNPIRVMTGVILLYTFGFILGALPSIVTILWTGRSSAGEMARMFAGSIVLHHFYSFNLKISLILLPVLLVLLAWWYRLYDNIKFAAILRNFRPKRALHYLCMSGIGMIIGFARYPQSDFLESPFPSLILFLSAISVALAWWFSVGENDIHDIKGDRVSNPERPLPSGILQSSELRHLSLIILILSLVAASVVRYSFFLPILVSVGLSFIFSAPPFRLKRILYLAPFIPALCSLLVCLAGFIIFSKDYSFIGFPPWVMVTIFVGFSLAITVKDIKDIEGDRLEVVKTIPVIFGERRGKHIIGILSIVAYLCVPILSHMLVLLPFSITFGGLTYRLITRKDFTEGPVFSLYYIFLAIVAIVVYFNIRQ